MSGIAHYHLHEQSVHTQQLATLSAQAPAAGMTQTSVPASFQQVTLSSQPIIAQPTASTLQPADHRQASVTATPASFEQLGQYARLQGWSENQLALMNRLPQYRNSHTGPAWSPVGGVRGIRNNNPGNLEASWAFTWQGQNGTDGRFATFASPEHGIRALGVNLLAYQRRGLDTISKIISRWAPPQDNNNTTAYIQNVSQALGVTPTTRLDVASPGVLTALSKAIIHQENGNVPFSDETIASGIASALGTAALSESPSPVLKASAGELAGKGNNPMDKLTGR
ncbi:hypothetical protein [Leclercia adecarboxylata]|uniref:hypothetical protein n=1 Tax=Leclercia adecarboxylata TaxID=83655 RepID=UPI0013C6ACEB|nr:hypothetical protein [Leclercia adecarboxylata]NEG92454.1 hypothetical protein [Leclercia adecarboxylata]